MHLNVGFLVAVSFAFTYEAGLNTNLCLPDLSLQGGLGCLIHTKCRVEKPKHCCNEVWRKKVLCCSHMSVEESLLCAA